MINARQSRIVKRMKLRRHQMGQAQVIQHQQFIAECEKLIPKWIEEAEKGIRKCRERVYTFSLALRSGLHYPHHDNKPKISELIEPLQKLISHFKTNNLKVELESALDAESKSKDFYYQIVLRW